jgi:hypothetical protein
MTTAAAAAAAATRTRTITTTNNNNSNNNNNNNKETKHLILYMPNIFIMRLNGPVPYCISILTADIYYLKATSI